MFTSWIVQNEVEHRLDSKFYHPVYIENAKKIKAFSSLRSFNQMREPTRPISYGVIKPEFIETGKGTPLIRNLDFIPPSIDASKVIQITSAQSKEFSRSELQPGDLLVTIGGYVGTAAIVPNGLRGANINQHIARVSLRTDDADVAFYWAFIESQRGRLLLEQWVSGTAQPGINLTDLKELKLPYPPIEIQRAIGNKVRKAERLREQTEKSRAHAEEVLYQGLRLDEFKPTYEQSVWSSREIFTAARSDAEYYQSQYIALEKHLRDLEQRGLEVARLLSLMKSGSYGVLPSSDDYGKGDLPFLRAQDLGHYILETDNPIKVPRYYNNPKAIAHVGDLLLEVKGNIAAGAICPPYADGWLVNGSIYRMSLDENVNATYVLAVLLSPLGELQKRRAAANSIISYLSLDYLNQLQIPRLSPEEEQEISSSISLYSEATLKMRELMAKSKADVEALIDSTLNEEALLREGEEIERWFKENPSS